MFLVRGRRSGQSPPPPRLLRHTEVPARVTESYILSGYRYPNSTLRDCLLSALRPTNETGNFWTHFLPVFVFAYHFLEPLGWEGAPPAADPFFYPLWTYFLGVVCLLAASSLAHLLNAMSLVVREVCFFVDYGTISAYTVGSSLAYFYYIHPARAGGLLGSGAEALNATRRGSAAEPVVPESPAAAAEAWAVPFFFDVLYVPSSCLVAVVCVLACCNTRQRWRRHRYLIRTLVFLLPFLVSSTPIFYRLLTASPYGAAGSSSAASSSASMARYFGRHCLWLVVSALFNISKVPERLAPGRFDVCGHSHQWFHLCTFMSILDELHMIKGEVGALLLLAQAQAQATPPLAQATPPPSWPRPPLPHGPPTLLSTYGVVLALQAVIAAVIARFSLRANAIYGEPERERGERERERGERERSRERERGERERGERERERLERERSRKKCH